MTDIRNEIKSIIAASGWQMIDIVSALNKKYPRKKLETISNLSNKLTRGTIKYREVKEIAEIIGYEIKWVKKEQD